METLGFLSLLAIIVIPVLLGMLVWAPMQIYLNSPRSETNERVPARNGSRGNLNSTGRGFSVVTVLFSRASDGIYSAQAAERRLTRPTLAP